MTPGAPGPANTTVESPLDAPGPLLPVVGAGLEVPVLGGRRMPYANLDYAATTPALVAVAERVADTVALAGSVHRGSGLPSQAASALYEDARRTITAAVGARDDDVAVLVRNTTDATNLLAGCIPPSAGDVVTLDVEHHATLLPWRRTVGHRCVAHAATVVETVERIEQALRERRTALLAVSGASNVTGEALPIDRLAALAHEHGARLLLDGAQLVAHRPIDIAALGVDYLAFSGHKLYAPYGSGVLVGRRDWLDAAAPYLAGGGAVREVTVSDAAWLASPSRHEGGTPNVAGAAAIAVAFETLAALDPDDRGARVRHDHEQALLGRLRSGLDAIPTVRRLRIWPDADPVIGVVAFTLDGVPSGLVAAALSAEHGVGLRHGRFCAHPLLARLGRDDGALRVSFGVGSGADEIDRLLDGLARIADGGPEHAYRSTDRGWVPVDDDRDPAGWVQGVRRRAA